MSTISSSSSIQVKVTLPAQLKEFVQSKANQYGLTLSTYIKHLVLDDVKNMGIPTFKMSEKTEDIAMKAIEDHKQGKTHKVDNVKEFINNL